MLLGTAVGYAGSIGAVVRRFAAWRWAAESQKRSAAFPDNSHSNPMLLRFNHLISLGVRGFIARRLVKDRSYGQPYTKGTPSEIQLVAKCGAGPIISLYSLPIGNLLHAE